MSAKARWLLIIVGLLVGNVVMMVVLVVASTGARPAIIPAYYDRAVAYDHELDDAERSRALGWRASATLDRDGARIDVLDRAGSPVVDARVALSGFQRAHADESFEVSSVPIDGGYRVARELRAGIYDLLITVERAGERFVARQTVELR